MDSEVSIVKLFCRDLAKELTIRRISQLLKKSYAFTNKEVWKVINKGVLNKKEIGKSIICSINLNNELTKALLAFNSSLEKQQKFPDKSFPELKDALTAFYSKNKLYVVTEKKTPIKNAKMLSKEEFLAQIKQIGLDNLIVYGYEKYWELIGDIYG